MKSILFFILSSVIIYPQSNYFNIVSGNSREIIHASVGKVSFDSKKLHENAMELLNTVKKLKPSSSKGIYFKSVSLSSTMSSSIKVDSSILMS